MDRVRKDLADLQKEKRSLESEVQNMTSEMSKMKSELKSATKDKEKFAKECDNLKSKNSSNLQQTQDGIKYDTNLKYAFLIYKKNLFLGHSKTKLKI